VTAFSSLPVAMQALIMGGAVLGAIVGILAYVTLLERKFAARMQSRIGPYRVGPHGLLQPIADGVKLLLKEDLMPDTADRPVFSLAPVVFLIPCLLMFGLIPFAPGIGVADLDTGVLFFLAVASMEIVGLFMAGWGSNNKYALLSVMRAVNQIISYDLPFLFAALVPVMLTGSLRMSDIAAAQQGLWFIAYPVIGHSKLARLMQVAKKTKVTVALDSISVARQLSEAAKEAQAREERARPDAPNSSGAMGPSGACGHSIHSNAKQPMRSAKTSRK
jgi:NADH:ubiquinone oxidoreductase subunit H